MRTVKIWMIWQHIFAVLVFLNRLTSAQDRKIPCGELKLEPGLHNVSGFARFIMTPTTNIPVYLLKTRKWYRNSELIYLHNRGELNDQRYTEDAFVNWRFSMTISRLKLEDSGDYSVACSQNVNSSEEYIYRTNTVHLTVKGSEVTTTTTTSTITSKTMSQTTMASSSSSKSGLKPIADDSDEDDADAGDNSTLLIIIIVSVVVIVLFVIIAVIVIVVRRRRREKSSAGRQVGPQISVEYSQRRNSTQGPNMAGSQYDNVENLHFAHAQQLPDEDQYALCDAVNAQHTHDESLFKGSSDADVEEMCSVEYAAPIPRSERQQADMDPAEYGNVIPKSQRTGTTKAEVTTGSEDNNDHKQEYTEYSTVIPKSQRLQGKTPRLSHNDYGNQENTEYSTVIPKSQRMQGKTTYQSNNDVSDN